MLEISRSLIVCYFAAAYQINATDFAHGLR